jgi:hypothetical protein
MAVFILPPNHSTLLEETREAFSVDTSYAIEIALSASDILNRKDFSPINREAL